MNKSFSIHNFGCKVNQEEGGAIAALFVACGWHESAEAEQPALIIINTCTVTQVADKKARNLIRRLRGQNPAAIIAVCGCYAQRAAAEIAAIGGVDIIAGVEERARLPQAVADFIAAGGQAQTLVGDIGAAREFRAIAADSHQHRARAYLKIEDGCDCFCHYCIIPHVRGPVRSLPLTQALFQAESLLDKGHAEIVLSGIHIGAYGRDLPPGQDLPALLKALCALPRLKRLRLGSIEPQQLSEDLLELFAAQTKICPHLHIPLQSGSERILKAMGRCYTTAEYAALLARLRRRLPHIAVTTDIMAGFPGETAAEHEESLNFCREQGFADMHIFPYSRRAGTKAAAFPGQIKQAEKARRAAEFSQMAAMSRQEYMRRFIGQGLELAAEENVVINGQSYWRGHSGNYLPLYLAGAEHPGPGLIAVRAIAMLADGMLVQRAVN